MTLSTQNLLAKLKSRRLANPLPIWKGEYLKKNQGAGYFNVHFSKFPESVNSKSLTHKIQMVLRHAATDRQYTASHEARNPKETSSPVWKMPTGQYYLKKIIVIDKSAVKRIWSPPSRRVLTVTSLNLSNFGLWWLSPASKSTLTVIPRMVTNTFRDSQIRTKGAFDSIIDGFTGRTQQVLHGEKIIQRANRGYAGTNDMRTDLGSSRQIVMVYKLDLPKHNHFAPAVSAVISQFDAQLRTCYTDLIQDKDLTEVKVWFKFNIEKESGLIDNLTYRAKQFPNKRFRECLYYILGQIQLPIRQSIGGKISFVFRSVG